MTCSSFLGCSSTLAAKNNVVGEIILEKNGKKEIKQTDRQILRLSLYITKTPNSNYLRSHHKVTCIAFIPSYVLNEAIHLTQTR